MKRIEEYEKEAPTGSSIDLWPFPFGATRRNDSVVPLRHGRAVLSTSARIVKERGGSAVPQ